jgi:hypothetical protein
VLVNILAEKSFDLTHLTYLSAGSSRGADGEKSPVRWERDRSTTTQNSP